MPSRFPYKMEPQTRFAGPSRSLLATCTRARLLFIVLLVAHAGCTAYQVGNRSLYPPDVQTVYVPIFTTSSYRRNLGERLTEAVIKEIELKTPLKVVNTPNADSVLTCELALDNKTVLLEAPTDEVRQGQQSYQVFVNWVNRKGDALQPQLVTPLPGPLVDVTQLVDVAQTANFIPEVGQSITTAQQKAIDRLAKQIVALMEAPW